MALDALERCPLPTNDGAQLLSYLLTRSVIPAENSPVKDTTDLIEKLANGMSVLLIDGCPAALAVSTQEMPQRSISQPNGEGDIRGSPSGRSVSPTEKGTSMVRRKPSPNCCAATSRCCGGSSAPAALWRRYTRHRPTPRPNTACAMTGNLLRLK